jgi:hypothetical protein
MFTPKLLTAAAMSTLCLLAALPHARAAGGDDQDRNGQSGMTVTRDPMTGKLRAPTPEELKALRAKAPSQAGLQAVRPSEPMALSRRADGARGVRLGEKTLVYEVVTRGADGKLSSQCVQGHDAAATAVTNAAGSTVASPNAAAAHDHEEHTHEAR